MRFTRQCWFCNLYYYNQDDGMGKGCNNKICEQNLVAYMVFT